MIPAFVGLVLASDGGHSWPAAIIFGAAGVTDQIDGWLARRWHVESRFGTIADPLADRLMIDAAVILLWNAGRLPWAALAIPARDLALVAGYKLVVERGYDFAVNLAGTGEEIAVWQWGNDPGYKNFVIGRPGQRVGVVVFTNGDRGAELYADVVRELLPGPHPSLEANHRPAWRRGWQAAD